jgi:hypothetical protein
VRSDGSRSLSCASCAYKNAIPPELIFLESLKDSDVCFTTVLAINDKSMLPVKIVPTQILSEFGFQRQHPTSVWCDNQSAIKLAKDPIQHQRSKHIELHMHFIKKLIHDQVIEVLFFPTEDQVADIFTKSLTKANFSKLRSMLGVQEAVIKGG